MRDYYQEIIEAYAKAKMKPVRGIYFNKTLDCGCAMGALCRANLSGITGENAIDKIIEFKEMLPAGHANAIIFGFDGELYFGDHREVYAAAKRAGLELCG